MADFYENLGLCRVRVPEPTPEQCKQGAEVTIERPGGPSRGYATWYPQMGGYTGKCVVEPEGGCFNVFVWHDGEFPFGGGAPVELHHCMTEQFRRLADFVDSLPGMERVGA